MKTRIIISIVFLGLGFILAAIPQNTTLKYKLTAEELLTEANNSVMFYSPDEVAQLLIQKDPNIRLIDVRTPDDYDKYALPNAINIPLSDLLSETYRDFLDQDVYQNILYSNGTTDAVKAWMILRQLGWENNFVLQGGLNYWAETILNPQAPPSTVASDEIARYDFRKGASQSLGGGSLESTEASVSSAAPKPMVKSTPKKKKAQGGC
ncbi:MAG: rhodanese-like domain-containing protein [Bacteroidota bacterium]|nr:MAG: rhodanese-like domain-containing protein [Bacteroidota bacterium]